MVELVYPENGAIVDIETPIQKEFIKRIKEEKPISEAYPVIDTDLARDNVENDIPDADLQDL